MIIRQFAFAIGLTLLLLAIFWWAPAQAQIDTRLRNAFDSVAVTDPQVAIGQRRGVVTGGHISMRFDTMSPPPLVQFSEPSFGSGCGGIDLNGGSLSFISKDAFIDYGKAVASNAAGYLFHLGLKELCGECENVLSDMRSLTHKLNLQMRNSCEMARTMVDGGMEVYKDWRINQAMTESNTVSDPASAHLSSTPPATQLANSDPERLRQLLEGNLTWRALDALKTAGGLDRWATMELEQVMSLTGTVVVCYRGTDGCPAGEGYHQQVIPPTLGLRDLVWGQGDDVFVLKCDSTQDCLKPSKEPANTTFEGLAWHLQDEFNERPAGIIYRLRYTDGEPDASDEALLVKLGPFATQIMLLARSNPWQAEQFVADVSPLIAVQILDHQLQLMIDEVHRAVSTLAAQMDSTEAEVFSAQLRDVRTRYFAERQQILDEVESRARMYEIYQHLAQSSRIRQIPTLGLGAPTD